MKKTYLRNAVFADADLLFHWANDDAVRKNSFNSGKISYSDHLVWFDKMMHNENVIQYILMEDETPIGQIRLTIYDDTAEIGYSIAKEFRGCGYGHSILKLVKDEVKKQNKIKKLVAKVKPENTASNSLFISEGYHLDYQQYSYDLSD